MGGMAQLNDAQYLSLLANSHNTTPKLFSTEVVKEHTLGKAGKLEIVFRWHKARLNRKLQIVKLKAFVSKRTSKVTKLSIVRFR